MQGWLCRMYGEGGRRRSADRPAARGPLGRGTEMSIPVLELFMGVEPMTVPVFGALPLSYTQGEPCAVGVEPTTTDNVGTALPLS